MGRRDQTSQHDPWHETPGQHRSRSIAATLEIAHAAAQGAGVTRLSDVTGLAPFGIPVFQATRPLARLLSVSQGKGLTPRAAMVSALLEAVELDCAERLPRPASSCPLRELDEATRRLWEPDDRDPLGVTLDPAVSRGWLDGSNLSAGGMARIPWDLVSLDVTCALPGDVRLSSVGLATGNTAGEARAAAVAELLEHDLQATMHDLSPSERRARELDLGTVADPIARALIARIRSRGFALRAWSMGQESGIAAFACAITDVDTSHGMLPPAAGSGCHPDRAIAFLRAMLEAVQSRITLIAGAREDLTVQNYRGAADQMLDLVLGGLSFGPGPLPWSAIPHHPLRDAERDLETLLAAAARRSSLPILLYTHEPPHPGLTVVRAIGPGLADLKRKPKRPAPTSTAAVAATRAFRSGRRPVLFVGPSLDRRLIPDAIDARPPAICGDLAALLADPPPAVGLIDGCFEVAPTVWHKEILDLIAHGVPVAGAASLGALRAAELHQLGMIGIGAIFEAYADERILRDDAVLITHAPAELNWRPLTVALVDAEIALQRAPLAPQERRHLQRIVRRTDFRVRTWKTCLDDYRARTGRSAPIDDDALENLATAKRDDALALVAALASGLPRPHPSPRPPQTAFYKIMLGKTNPPPSAAPLRGAAHALPA